jgi:ABC-type transport system involved in multi-copper enzyme maturation permease subunit
MHLEVPLALGGPVLHWELVRSARRVWCRVLHYSFLAWLSFQSALILGGWGEENNALTKVRYARSPKLAKIDLGYERWATQRAQASSGLYSLLDQQLIIILLLTPVCAAGALGYEKEQDTLTALLGTQLQAREIVAGKFLGRLVLLLRHR